MIEWLPAVSVVIVSLADEVVPTTRGTAGAMGVPPWENVTDPVGLTVPEAFFSTAFRLTSSRGATCTGVDMVAVVVVLILATAWATTLVVSDVLALKVAEPL